MDGKEVDDDKNMKHSSNSEGKSRRELNLKKKSLFAPKFMAKIFLLNRERYLNEIVSSQLNHEVNALHVKSESLILSFSVVNPLCYTNSNFTRF